MSHISALSLAADWACSLLTEPFSCRRYQRREPTEAEQYNGSYFYAKSTLGWEQSSAHVHGRHTFGLCHRIGYSNLQKWKRRLPVFVPSGSSTVLVLERIIGHVVGMQCIIWWISAKRPPLDSQFPCKALWIIIIHISVPRILWIHGALYQSAYV